MSSSSLSVDDLMSIIEAERQYWLNSEVDLNASSGAVGALSNVICAVHGHRAPWHPVAVPPVPLGVSEQTDEPTDDLADFRACQSFVLDLKPKLFPEGSVVRVDVPQFRGHGIVHRLTGENEIQVLLENGNVWAYPSLCCFPEPDASNWPAWIKRKKEVPDEQPQS